MVNDHGQNSKGKTGLSYRAGFHVLPRLEAVGARIQAQSGFILRIPAQNVLQKKRFIPARSNKTNGQDFSCLPDPWF
jgi:hypothetical protein